MSEPKPTQSFASRVKGKWKKIGVTLIAIDIIATIIFIATGGPDALSSVIGI